jgi:xanthine dehydrogenase molybdopterin-binding subunit B
MPGVVKIIFASDIPGKNTFTIEGIRYTAPELLFAEDKIEYAGQSIGLVIAKSYNEALEAARAVKITYKNFETPILNIKDAIQANSYFDPPVNDFIVGDAEKAINSSVHIIQNDFSMGGQFHFFLENLVAVCEPYENYYKLIYKIIYCLLKIFYNSRY